MADDEAGQEKAILLANALAKAIIEARIDGADDGDVGSALAALLAKLGGSTAGIDHIAATAKLYL